MPLRGRTLAIGACTAVVACSMCTNDKRGAGDADAGYTEHPDAGRLDAEITADLDAPSSADVDASAFFVGPWSPLPGNPASCANVRYALDPARSVPAWQWVPCPSGRAGCRRLVVDWPMGDGPSLRIIDPESARLINGTPYMSYIRIWPRGIIGDFAAMMYVVQPVDGAPVFAVGQTREGGGACLAGGAIGMGDYGVAFTTHVDLNAWQYAWAPWGAPMSLAAKTLSKTDLAGTPDRVSVSATQLFLDTTDPSSTDVFTLQTQAVAIPGSPRRMPGRYAVVGPDGALARDFRNIYVLHPDASYEALILPSPSRVVSGFALDRSTPTTLVWVESQDLGFSYGSSIIWASPYAATTAGLQRRAVAHLDDATGRGGYDFIANAGVSLTYVSKTRALLTRLADGMGWYIDGEPSDRSVTPLWVDANDVWLLTGYNAINTTGVLRIGRASLGAPTVPSGF